MPNLSYYKSRWTRDDLNGKTVEFSLKGLSHSVVGIGTFRVHVYQEMIAVVIVESHPAAGHDHEFVIYSPDIADKIEIHPDKAKADFRLVAP